MSALLPFDICRRLHDAGLPQPELSERGQYWYTFHGHLILVAIAIENTIYTADLAATDPIHNAGPELGKITRGHTVIKSKLDDGRTRTQYLYNGLIYHPTTDYLLAHLPETIKIEKYNKQWMLIYSYGKYELSDNLFHAAASAYLHLHEKKPAT